MSSALIGQNKEAHKSELIGVVLAGGQSRRMGRDKAMLVYAGAPLIEHMIGLLQQSGCSAAYVSGDFPQYQSISDEFYQRGPLGGLHSIAQRFPNQQVLVVPVDMPDLSVNSLQRLAAAPEAACVRIADFVLPMRIHTDANCLVHILDLLKAPIDDGFERPSLRSLQNRLDVVCLDQSGLSDSEFANANTPQEWRKLSQ